MTPTQQKNDIIDAVMEETSCSMAEADTIANYFASLMIEQIKKLKYLNDEPQIKFWNEVKNS